MTDKSPTAGLRAKTGPIRDYDTRRALRIVADLLDDAFAAVRHSATVVHPVPCGGPTLIADEEPPFAPGDDVRVLDHRSIDKVRRCRCAATGAEWVVDLDDGTSAFAANCRRAAPNRPEVLDSSSGFDRAALNKRMGAKIDAWFATVPHPPGWVVAKAVLDSAETAIREGERGRALAEPTAEEVEAFRATQERFGLLSDGVVKSLSAFLAARRSRP